jgi:hypothetical protein
MPEVLGVLGQRLHRRLLGDLQYLDRSPASLHSCPVDVDPRYLHHLRATHADRNGAFERSTAKSGWRRLAVINLESAKPLSGPNPA